MFSRIYTGYYKVKAPYLAYTLYLQERDSLAMMMGIGATVFAMALELGQLKFREVKDC